MKEVKETQLFRCRTLRQFPFAVQRHLGVFLHCPLPNKTTVISSKMTFVEHSNTVIFPCLRNFHKFTFWCLIPESFSSLHGWMSEFSFIYLCPALLKKAILWLKPFTSVFVMSLVSSVSLALHPQNCYLSTHSCKRKWCNCQLRVKRRLTSWDNIKGYKHITSPCLTLQAPKKQKLAASPVNQFHCLQDPLSTLQFITCMAAWYSWYF